MSTSKHSDLFISHPTKYWAYSNLKPCATSSMRILFSVKFTGAVAGCLCGVVPEPVETAEVRAELSAGTSFL